jgi:NDP-sugar pyrophosphorylase family protein
MRAFLYLTFTAISLYIYQESILKIMKRLVMSFGIAFALLTGCKKETVTTETTEQVSPDGTTVTTTTTTTTDTDYDFRLKKAEEDYNAAEADVKAAQERGDTKAEEVARKAADKAKDAWEVTKREVRQGLEKTGDAIKEAGSDIKNSVRKKDTVILK